MLVKMQRNWVTYLVGERCKTAYALWKTVWQFLVIKKHATALKPSNHILGHLFQRKEHFCSHKNLCKVIHRSLICNSWKLKTTHSKAEWTKHRTLVIGKRNKLLIHWTTWLVWISRGLSWVKKQPQKVIYCIMTFM